MHFVCVNFNHRLVPLFLWLNSNILSTPCGPYQGLTLAPQPSFLALSSPVLDLPVHTFSSPKLVCVFDVTFLMIRCFYLVAPDILKSHKQLTGLNQSWDGSWWRKREFFSACSWLCGLSFLRPRKQNWNPTLKLNILVPNVCWTLWHFHVLDDQLRWAKKMALEHSLMTAVHKKCQRQVLERVCYLPHQFLVNTFSLMSGSPSDPGGRGDSCPAFALEASLYPVSWENRRGWKRYCWNHPKQT